MRRFLHILPIAGVLVASLSLPAGAATDPSILALSHTATTNAAHAKKPHFVANADLLALAPTNGNGVVSLVYPLGGFSNSRIAGFTTIRLTSAQCVLFPARVGAAPSPVTCPAGGTPNAFWAPRVTAAHIATLVNNKAYALSRAPSIATLNAAARARGVVPAGYRVAVTTGTNIKPSVKYSVTHLSGTPVSVCVSTTTKPGITMAFLSSYGLAPC